MGSSSSEFPDLRFPAEALPPEHSMSVPPLRASQRPPEPVRRYVALFIMTALTTTLSGALHYWAYQNGFNPVDIRLTPGLLLSGLWYSVSILAILGAHEFGHYFACRYYGVNASLPYFLPLPPFPFLTGTLGAVIRIREPIPTKRAL